MISKIFLRSVCLPLRNARCISTTRKSPTTSFVLTEEIGDKGVLILNRPQAMNAMNNEMLEKLYATIDEWQNTKSMIIVKINVDKTFSAGGDIAAMIKAESHEHAKSIFHTGYSLEYLIANLKIPYIALLNGITMGGGVGITVNGKYRIATDKTIFAMPEASIGLFPDSSGTYFLPRLQGKLGYYLGLTGSRLKGADVFHAGIATHYCESDNIPKIENTLLSLRNTNDLENVINDICPKPNTEFSLSKHLEEINENFDAYSIEQILSNLEKNNTEWANKTIKTLRKTSPTSLKVTLCALNLGKSLTLRECFQMEYRLACRLIQSADFCEGVRALITTKNNTPMWNPATINDVTDAHILPLFEPLPNNEDISTLL